MKPEKLYRLYFSPGARGYEFIRAFHAKHFRDFAKTELADFDALANQIFLNVAAIAEQNIHGIEEHYVIKSIYFQCWKLLLRESKKEKTIIAESRLIQPSDSPAESPIENLPAGDNPEKTAEANDLLEKIIRFRETLKKRDRKILNALIDNQRPLDIAHDLKLNYNLLSIRILRMREKLMNYLDQMERFGKIKKY
ncbi:hypothetical protein HUU42_15590 [bacterium]|nr:hypothetical protein [bacterium]